MNIRNNPIFKIFNVFIIIIIIIILSSVSSRLVTMIMYGEIDSEKFSYGVILQSFFGFYALLFSAILTKGKLFKHGYQLVKNYYLIKVFFIVIVLEVVLSYVFSFFPVTGKGHFADDLSFLQKIFSAGIVASVSEEVWFRGLIQSYFEPMKKYRFKLFSINLSLPVILSAIFFMLIHIPLVIDDMDKVVAIEILITTLLLGFIAGYYREKSDSLIPAIFAHSLVNIYASIF